MQVAEIQKVSRVSTAKLKLKAIRLFNAFIRERDKDQPCISCGGAVQQAGHFYSAGHHNHLRFDEDNCHGQCVRCNYFLSGNLLNYRIGLEKKIGQKAMGELDLKAKMRFAHKDDRFTLIDIIQKYGRKKAKSKAEAIL